MKYHVFPTLTRFRETTWAEVKAGDIVHYFIHRHRELDRKAYGPFLVVDPVRGVLSNPQGIEVTALKWHITLLVPEGLA